MEKLIEKLLNLPFLQNVNFFHLIPKAESGIRIKKENRGKFTEYCNGKVTSECIARGKKSSSAKIRKRATFAANARKWKHESGSRIHKPFGHNLDNVIGNGWTASKRKLVKKHDIGGLMTSFKPVQIDYDDTNIPIYEANLLDLISNQMQNINNSQLIQVPIKQDIIVDKSNIKPAQPVNSLQQPKSNPDIFKYEKYDIEDVFKDLGLTSFVNRKGEVKQIKFGNKALRALNASIGSKNSNHKKKDPITGNAMARDISIINGTLEDYEDFKNLILNTPELLRYLKYKNWGIINEVTSDILKSTRGTGMHFHFGPDQWAIRTLNAWQLNPNIHVSKRI